MSTADDLSNWAAELDPTPAAIMLVPAGTVPDLRGRRVTIGLPGIGWRHDLRADTPVVQGSRTFVPVLAEQDWYRAEAEQIEVFAPLVPIERVWAEVIGAVPGPAQPSALSLVSLDMPPHLHPHRASDVPHLTGRRIIHVQSPADQVETHRRDLRAVTEAHANKEGDICVRIAMELDWYRWSWSGQSPRTLQVPINLVWVE